MRVPRLLVLVVASAIAGVPARAMDVVGSDSEPAPAIADDPAWAPAETTFVVAREYFDCSEDEALALTPFCRANGLAEDDAWCLLHIARRCGRPFLVVYDDWRLRCHRDFNELLALYGFGPEVFVAGLAEPVDVWFPPVFARPFACWRRHDWSGVALTPAECHALIALRIALQFDALTPVRFFDACRHAPAPLVVALGRRDDFGRGGRDCRGERLRVRAERPWLLDASRRAAWRGAVRRASADPSVAFARGAGPSRPGAVGGSSAGSSAGPARSSSPPPRRFDPRQKQPVPTAPPAVEPAQPEPTTRARGRAEAEPSDRGPVVIPPASPPGPRPDGRGRERSSPSRPPGVEPARPESPPHANGRAEPPGRGPIATAPSDRGAGRADSRAGETGSARAIVAPPARAAGAPPEPRGDARQPTVNPSPPLPNPSPDRGTREEPNARPDGRGAR